MVPRGTGDNKHDSNAGIFFPDGIWLYCGSRRSCLGHQRRVESAWRRQDSIVAILDYQLLQNGRVWADGHAGNGGW